MNWMILLIAFNSSFFFYCSGAYHESVLFAQQIATHHHWNSGIFMWDPIHSEPSAIQYMCSDGKHFAPMFQLYQSFPKL